MGEPPSFPASAPARVAILGGGPVGLDAALACADAGLDCTVYEAGSTAGDHARAWGHVRMFTPWSMNVSARMRAHHPAAPDGAGCPTGLELAEHLLRPLAATPALAGRIRLRHRVRGVARRGLLKHEEIATRARAAAPFVLLVEDEEGERIEEATMVLDCTGSYANPNPLGAGGLPAPGETALGDLIRRTMPARTEPEAWRGTVLLVGAGKSAQTAARDLAALPGTRLEWVVRDPDPDWGAVADDPLPGRAALVETSRRFAAAAHRRVRVHPGTTVTTLRRDGDQVAAVLDAPSGVYEIRVDHVLGLTGYLGDTGLYRQLQVHECYATAAPMNLSATLLAADTADCLAQPAAGIDTLRNPEPGFFVLGAKSYGRLNSFLLRVGYEQVDALRPLLAGLGDH